jgi:photosystem II stability/assembly factor-like uncharacterized protein
MTRCLAVILVLLAFGCGSDGSGDSAPSPINPAAVDPGPDPTPDPSLQPGWVQQETGTQLDFTAISAVDVNHAWAAAGPNVFRTVDGGATWTFISQAPEISGLEMRPDILNMQFHDQNNGWAMTFYSALRTTDGGETWEERFGSLVYRWAGFSSINATTAWMTSEKSGDIVRTQDGGGSWDGAFVGGGLGRAVKFVDANLGWLALRHGDVEKVHKTTDGGATWQGSLSISGDYDALWIRDITTSGPNHVWVVAGTSTGGAGGEKIMASSDGGATWTEQHSDGSGGLWDVHFMDANNGWIAGRKIHRTTNGGTTWTVQDTPTEGFRDLVFVTLNVGWAVGENGVILKTTNGGD